MPYNQGQEARLAEQRLAKPAKAVSPASSLSAMRNVEQPVH